MVFIIFKYFVYVLIFLCIWSVSFLVGVSISVCIFFGVLCFFVLYIFCKIGIVNVVVLLVLVWVLLSRFWFFNKIGIVCFCIVVGVLYLNKVKVFWICFIMFNLLNFIN